MVRSCDTGFLFALSFERVYRVDVKLNVLPCEKRYQRSAVKMRHHKG